MSKHYEGWTDERLDSVIANSNHNIQRLGKVSHWDTKVEMKCLDCGHVWYPTPYNIRQGTGCPECYRRNKVGLPRKAKYTTNEVVEILNGLGFKLLDDEYINATTPMDLKCEKCGSIFPRTLMSLKRGYVNCPTCKHTRAN